MGVLQHLSDQLAAKIFNTTNLSLGAQTEFYYQWSQWINKLNNKSTIVTESTKQYDRKCVIENVYSTSKSSVLKLEDILSSNLYGASVMKTFKEQRKLDGNARKLLCEAVLHFCIEKEHSLSVQDSEDLTKQIVISFPGELSVNNFPFYIKIIQFYIQFLHSFKFLYI